MSSIRKFSNTTGENSGRQPGEPHPDWQENVRHFYQSMDDLVGWDRAKIEHYSLAPKNPEPGDEKVEGIVPYRTVFNEQNIILYFEFRVFTEKGTACSNVNVHIDQESFRKRVKGLQNFLINKRYVCGYKPSKYNTSKFND